MKYWLMKSEPDVYSIDHLKRDKTTIWDGVRNYQARNFMRDEMQEGDLAIFYHSNTEPPGAAGVMKVVGKPIPDPSQFDEKSKYFDEKSTKENPRWITRQLQFVESFKRILSLEDIRNLKACQDMIILRRGNRLSITPLTKKEFEAIRNHAN